MRGYRDQSLHSFSFALLFLFLFGPNLVATLHVTPNSKCTSVCESGSPLTTPEDIVCYDNEFSSTANGSRFQKCVECELGSTDVDTSSGMTDVLWGIFNLRYAVSTCVYGHPVQKASLSTPCQVSCDSLQTAVELGISDDPQTEANSTNLDFCNNPRWAEVIINRCVYCYNWTSTERYMSNFLQSLHNACRVPPATGSVFPIDPTLIFSGSQVSAPPSMTAAPTKHTIPNLPLIIALPTVFVSLIFLTTIVCCTFCVRRRRRRMAASGNMDRVHQGAWGDPNIASIYGDAYPAPLSQPPAWGKNSPGFASQRNSGMGWAQQLTSFGGMNKRSSRGSNSHNANYYDGWGNTFSPGSPRDWAEGTQLQERYTSSQQATDPNSTTTKVPITTTSAADDDHKIPLSPPPQNHHPDIKHPFATTTGHQRRTSFSRPFNSTTNVPPPPSRPTTNSSYDGDNQTQTQSSQKLNLKIPPAPALRTQNTNGTSVVSPDDYPHYASAGGGGGPFEDYNNHNDYKFPTPYHDLSSPESASTDRGVRGQSFVFDEGRKRWVKDSGGDNSGGGKRK